MVDKFYKIFRSLFSRPLTQKFFHSKEYFQHRLEIEKLRALRNNDKISVIIINCNALKNEFKFSFVKKEYATFLEHIFDTINSFIRGIDVAAWYDENIIAILLSDTSIQGANQFIKRLKDRLFQFFVDDYSENLFLFDKIDCRIYTFPGKHKESTNPFGTPESMQTNDLAQSTSWRMWRHQDDCITNNETKSINSEMLEAINLDGQFSKNFQCQQHDFVKRVFDIILSYLGLLLFAPLMGIIAVFVKCTSSGSVIFRQQRIGYDGHVFEMLKFRTMFTDADEKIHETHIKQIIEENSMQQNPESTSFKIPNDHRITPIGRLLRNTCLDELPQLINVFKGEMSLVGPRPHPVYEVSCYKEWFHRRLNVKPGLTGLWQIQGKKSMRYSDAIRLDLSYIDRRSFGLDLKILLFTVPTALAGLRSN